MAPVIESLFPEFCNQGGDNGNMMYLRACLPDAEFIETAFGDEPAFVTRDVDLIYLGCMTEKEQELVAAKLAPHRDRLVELAERSCAMLFTGNAADLAGTALRTADGRTVPGLALFDFTVQQDFSDRIVEVFLGSFDPGADGAAASSGAEAFDVAGYKIQFTQAQPSDGAVPAGSTAPAAFPNAAPFATAEVGFGLNRASRHEGFRHKNCLVTWLSGPLLPLNPLLTEHVLRLLGASPARAAFREQAMAAYRKRVEEFRTPGIKMPI